MRSFALCMLVMSLQCVHAPSASSQESKMAPSLKTPATQKEPFHIHFRMLSAC
jgi:hypothetical protein